MVAGSQRPELVVIVGPTASGKSDLAMCVAKNYDGEIITADSRTIYRGMDIGTAKPSRADQKEVPHWGLDLMKPGQRFTAYQFNNYAVKKIVDIQNKGRLPILVGGTGLYINAVLFSFDFLPDADLKKRAKLEALETAQLQQIIQTKGYRMPVNNQNKRHIIRAIETKGESGTKSAKPLADTVIIGIMPPDDVLRDRINKRAEQTFANGIVEETKTLIKMYGRDAINLTGGIVYKICQRLIDGVIDAEEAKELDKIADWQYARRQRTWFKRNPYIKWFDDSEQAYRFIIDQLNT